MQIVCNKKVNILPVPTWSWLKINDSQMNFNMDVKQEEMKCSRDVPNGIRLIEKEDLERILPSVEEIKTGMGEEVGAFLHEMETEVTGFLAEKGCQVGEPLLLHYTSRDQEASFEDQIIYAREGSEMTVIMDYSSAKDSESLFGMRTRIYAEKNALVRVIKLQLLGEKADHFDDIGAVCEDQAKVEVVQLEIGGNRGWSGCHTRLKGFKSTFDSGTGYLCREQQKLDINYVAVHEGKKTDSRMEVKGALLDQAEKVFRGTIDFCRGAKGSVGEEQEETLLFGRDVINKTIPLILCGEEEVEGNHGATIGRIDESLLFYMQSRGIGEDEAKEMIIRAGIDAVCRRIPHEPSVRLVQSYIEEVFQNET